MNLSISYTIFVPHTKTSRLQFIPCMLTCQVHPCRLGIYVWDENESWILWKRNTIDNWGRQPSLYTYLLPSVGEIRFKLILPEVTGGYTCNVHHVSGKGATRCQESTLCVWITTLASLYHVPCVNQRPVLYNNKQCVFEIMTHAVPVNKTKSVSTGVTLSCIQDVVSWLLKTITRRKISA